MDEDTIPRKLAKWLVVSAISMKATQITSEAITDNSNLEKDDIVVKLGSGAVGLILSANLKPYTDKMVDKTADFIVEKRNEIKSKKNRKKDEEK